ncbi:hypothetical protein [Marinifilum flexuosum]|uniref:Uncharacterized protein n=1 Tax=Marinifilum flexuosum TaxID=1117708 RepID=A0A419X9B2_9BACT|nr:hypothetical protein [Marinifilum flexuosum]RKE04321.1 hypothetical protein BXY64_1341 [Marinifilum flexuosum]
MEAYKEGMYRIEVINLEGDVVYLSLDSQNRYCEESLPGNLPEDAYTVRITGNDDYLFDKLLLAEEC